MKKCATAFCVLFLSSCFALTSFGQKESATSYSLRTFNQYHSFDPLIFSPIHSQLPFAESGIREIVPARFTPRYAKWKSELLLTEFGRKLWSEYEKHPQFQLSNKIPLT